jgi:hypothetical protein
MFKINIHKHNIIHENTHHAYQKDLSGIQFEQFNWILKQKTLNFPCKTVKIIPTIMIQINLYIQDITLDEEQHSTMGNMRGILFKYTSYVSSIILFTVY